MIAAFYAGFINYGTRNAKKDAEIKVLTAEKAGKIGIRRPPYGPRPYSRRGRRGSVFLTTET